MLAIVLSLGTSLAYGTSNFLGPLLGRRHPVAGVLLFSQLAALVGTVVLVLASGDRHPGAHDVAVGFLAGAGNVVGLACFYRAAQLGSVSIAAALGALGTTLPVFWGLAHDDTLTPVQVAGIVLAVGGAVLAAQGPAGAEDDPHDTSTASIGWALVSAVGFGVFLVALPEAAQGGTAWALLDARFALVALLIGGIVVLRQPVAAPPASTPLLAVPGILLFGGTLAYAEATSRGQLSIVAVLASLATVVTVALAFVVLHERLAPIQRAGVGFAVVGTVLLAI